MKKHSEDNKLERDEKIQLDGKYYKMNGTRRKQCPENVKYVVLGFGNGLKLKVQVKSHLPIGNVFSLKSLPN